MNKKQTTKRVHIHTPKYEWLTHDSPKPALGSGQNIGRAADLVAGWCWPTLFFFSIAINQPTVRPTGLRSVKQKHVNFKSSLQMEIYGDAFTGVCVTHRHPVLCLAGFWQAQASFTIHHLNENCHPGPMP